MVFALRSIRHRIALSGWLLLLLLACGREAAYEKSVREQEARSAAVAEEQQMAQAEADAKAEAERVQREQAEFAFESDPPALLSEDQLHQVLGYYCGDCHFFQPCPNCEPAGILLDDVDEMLLQGTLIPGNAEGSPVIQQMREHRMPLPDVIPRASEIAITLVADFINHLPAEPDPNASGASR